MIDLVAIFETQTAAIAIAFENELSDELPIRRILNRHKRQNSERDI